MDNQPDKPTFVPMERAEHKGHFIEVIRTVDGRDTEVQIGFIGGKATENLFIGGQHPRAIEEAKTKGIARVNERSL